MNRPQRQKSRRASGPVTALRVALLLLVVIAAIGAGAVVARQMGAVSWSVFGRLAAPWDTVWHITAQVGVVFAVVALVSRVRLPARWLTLSAGGLLLAASLLALRAMHGAWEADIFVPGGRFHRGSWSTVDDLVAETLAAGLAMVAAGVIGFARARRRAAAPDDTQPSETTAP